MRTKWGDAICAYRLLVQLRSMCRWWISFHFTSDRFSSISSFLLSMQFHIFNFISICSSWDRFIDLIYKQKFVMSFFSLLSFVHVIDLVERSSHQSTILSTLDKHKLNFASCQPHSCLSLVFNSLLRFSFMFSVSIERQRTTAIAISAHDNYFHSPASKEKNFRRFFMLITAKQ